MKLYSDQRLNDLRKTGDPAADVAVKDLVKHPQFITTINEWPTIPAELPQVFTPAIAEFFNFYHQPLDQWDAIRVKQVQEFFSQNGNRYLAMLGFYSLPYCYAFADGAKVLYRSKRIMDDPGERLFETASFILDAFEPGTFHQENKGLLVLAKVRLIHAFSRYFIVKHDPSWSNDWGIPVNQEDMVGTNLAFSLLVIRGFRKLGKPMTLEESENLLYYWKVIGHYLGLEVSLLPDTMKEANALEKLIRQRHLKPSKEGKALMKGLLKHFEEGPQPAAGFADKIVAFLTGPEAAAALGLHVSEIPRPVWRLLLNFGLVPPFSQTGHLKLKSEFQKQSKLLFGKKVNIQLPVFAKP